MPAAADSPLPMTSPAATARRPSGSRNASYQSPPISMFRVTGRSLASRMMPGTLGSRSGSRLRCSVSAVVCSRSNSEARSTASAHWPASASRNTRSSSVIFRGRENENRSAPIADPAASNGIPTQARSSVWDRNRSRSATSAKVRRSASGFSTITGRRVVMARLMTLGTSSGMSSPGWPGLSGRPPGFTVCTRSRSGSSRATAERSAPIADRPTSVITSTTCSTVSASASMEVACCSRAVRSAAAESCSVSRPRISSASRWAVTSVLAPTHSMILPSRSIGTARTS